jgi:excinuclease ABC subunit B
MFVTSPDVLQGAIWQIQQDLVKQVDYFKEKANTWKQNV